MNMKLSVFIGGRERAFDSAFTITEMMISVGLFGLVVVGGISLHLLGLRMSTITDSKLKATQSARGALNSTRDEIRCAQSMLVGAGSQNGFVTVSGAGPRAGNALQIYPSSDTNIFIRYYLDPVEQTLRRWTSGSSTSSVVALFVTNAVAFTAEDFAGQTLTSDQNNAVIRMNLEFSQVAYSAMNAGGSNLVDSYRVQTKCTRRAIQ
jgi:hypothetical protein